MFGNYSDAVKIPPGAGPCRKHFFSDLRKNIRPCFLMVESFFEKMIDELAVKYKIDQSRNYSTGISNGALMSYRLACELTDKFAAIAAVAGN